MAQASPGSDHPEEILAADVLLPASTLRRRATASLKKSAYLEPYLYSLAAEAGIQSRDHASSVFETQSKTSGRFHSGETDFAGLVEDLSEIGKKRHVEPGVDFPAILGIQRD